MVDQLAVLGSPIAHSKSPALHRAAYRVLGRDWEYGSAELVADQLAGFVGGLDSSWRGLSLTMPLKNAAFALSEPVDDASAATGAVNTLRFADGRVLGFNTDVEGIARAVNAAGLRAPQSVLVLGGGATAASALLAAERLGASNVEVAVRAPERAAHIQRLASQLGVDAAIRRFDVEERSLEHELVISTLPGGVDAPEHYTAPSRRHALLLDVAYSPWPSALAREWHAASGRVLNGLAMLVHQALLQVRIFDAGDTGTPLPDEAAVLHAMLAAVDLPADGLMRA
ncbi:shikimate dehydrogenase [Paramicrobacterium humi]|uniref:Shikimate dehydrogenase n=1 Tax=Paramicrobacterium humi TaxID=640635 RepID=A0A1H4QS40_9MICO|nr:hypothetical protein [Microbacterium humi]SEC22274.1 shikimate dehydrogenase [Microbacterium humi]